MSESHVLHLGSGVQSTTLFLLDAEAGLVREDGARLKFDVAVFADTGEEEQETYQHLEWLRTVPGGAKIVTVSTGSRLGTDLQRGIQKSSGTRFASIPAFTATPAGRGMTRRQCTREYKIEPIEKWVRRELLGLRPRQRLPRDVRVTSYFGFSTDEPGRAARTRGRFDAANWRVDFPLLWESLLMSRQGCLEYLRTRVPHEVIGSVCTFCPFKSNRMWRRLKEKPDSTDWDRACEIDEALRNQDSVSNTGMDYPMFVHRSCVPLRDAYLDEDQLTLFDLDCEGGCGL